MKYKAMIGLEQYLPKCGIEGNLIAYTRVFAEIDGIG
jgi:hypothetical protein